MSNTIPLELQRNRNQSKFFIQLWRKPKQILVTKSSKLSIIEYENI